MPLTRQIGPDRGWKNRVAFPFPVKIGEENGLAVYANWGERYQWRYIDKTGLRREYRLSPESKSYFWQETVAG